MKSSIGSLWLFSIMVVFILIFACYLIVTIEYNKVYKMKNEILTIIENNNGLTDIAGTTDTSASGESITVGAGGFQTVNAFLLGSAYQAKGKCPSGSEYTNRGQYWYGVYKLDVKDISYDQVDENKKYYYCFCKVRVSEDYIEDASYYYRIRLFFMFNFPVIQYLGVFDVDGTTALIYKVNDNIPEKY